MAAMMAPRPRRAAVAIPPLDDNRAAIALAVEEDADERRDEEQQDLDDAEREDRLRHRAALVQIQPERVIHGRAIHAEDAEVQRRAVGRRREVRAVRTADEPQQDCAREEGRGEGQVHDEDVQPVGVAGAYGEDHPCESEDGGDERDEEEGGG